MYYEEALQEILKEAKIDPKKDYQIFELLPKPKLIEQFLQGKSILKGKIEHSLDLKNNLKEKDKNSYLNFQYIYQK